MSSEGVVFQTESIGGPLCEFEGSLARRALFAKVICIPKIWSPSEPGPLLAALFCTSLAPFCGRFGPLAGFAAGALHLPTVMHIAAIHGFMNLYNNGFASGLTMLILVGVIKGINPVYLEEPSPGK